MFGIFSNSLLAFSFIAPSTTKMLPEDYVERVKHVHEHGGYGSRGYVIFFFLFSNLIFELSMHYKKIFCPVDMDMIGKGRKQTRTYCELTPLLFPQGCFTC